MTDEEMAEQYAVENWEHYEEGQTDYKALKQAYLAGLKAGRPKWHKVANGDYPPCEKGNYTINVLTDKGDIEYYLAYSEYEKYFKSVPIPFKKSDGTKLTRNKLMFTQDGAQWAENRFSTRG